MTESETLVASPQGFSNNSILEQAPKNEDDDVQNNIFNPIEGGNSYNVIELKDVLYSTRYTNFNFNFNHHNLLFNFMPKERQLEIEPNPTGQMFIDKDIMVKMITIRNDDLSS